MPSTKTLNQSQTIGATEDADLLWIWDNSSAELDKISLGNLFAANQTFALLAGRSGGQTLIGGTAANDDLTLEGTSSATRTTSYVILQPNGGNVGIGTASPGAKLEIYDNSNGGIIHLTRDAGNLRGVLKFGRNNSGSYQNSGQIDVNASDNSANNGYMRFGATNNSGTLLYPFAATGTQAGLIVGNTWATDPTTYFPPSNGMIIEGNVGIGTASPSRKLHVAGTILIDGDESGIAGTIGLTDVNDAVLSTGNGTVKLKGTTARDSAGFIKIYVGITTAWIPYWTNIS